MSWTNDRVELLKKLWGEGKTASEIAKMLGGITRNAVIGKAHRLKLSGRVSPIAPPVKKAGIEAPSNSNAAPKRTLRKMTDMPVNIPVKRIKLSDLKDRQCRWPLGDPRDEDFSFCGCRAVSGIPYCTDHAQIAYQAATRKKMMITGDFDGENKRSQTDEETLESLRQAG